MIRQDGIFDYNDYRASNPVGERNTLGIRFNGPSMIYTEGTEVYFFLWSGIQFWSKISDNGSVTVSKKVS